MMQKMRKAAVIKLILILALSPSIAGASKGFGFVGKDFDGVPCRGKRFNFGPFDYRTASSETKSLVESYHFTPESENFIMPDHGNFSGDFMYTLNAFPNHQRALLALIRLETEIIPNVDPGYFPGRYVMKAKTICYLKRANAFAPDDVKVQMLMAYYLQKVGRLDEAEKWYRRVIEADPKASEAYYNLGLLLVDSGRLDDAVTVAKKAYSLGYPLPGLKNKLEAAGYPLPETTKAAAK